MPIDTSIYGQIQPTQGPLDRFARLQQLKSSITSNKLQELQQQQAQNQLNEQNAVRGVFQNAPEGSTLESMLPDLMKASPSNAAAYQKAALENKQLNVGLQEKLIPHLASSIATIIQDPSDDNVRLAGEAYTKATGQPHDDVTNYLLSLDPQHRKQQILSLAMSDPHGQAAVKMLFPEVKTTAVTPDMTGSITATHIQGIGNAPVLPKANVDTGPMDLTKESPADVQAGWRYLQDGTLPPNMGRGIQGTAQATKIRNIAAQLAQQQGINPEDVRTGQYAFKGSGSALGNIQKREAMIGTNEKNFNYNADQVLQLSKKVDRTGTPIINSWINAGRRSVQGNPELSAFDTAVKTTVNEFAQIVSGTTSGASTEGEKAKAEALLNAQQTPEQILAVINQMRTETQNRMKSFRDQKTELRQGMSGKQENNQQNTSGVAKISSDEEYNKLPSGTKFVGPDGKTRTKP
jgi:hypothetical protein